MLKLPKGLKKKKKSKKSKKDQELFTEEELEQYKREHRDQSLVHSAATSDTEEAAEKPAEKSENDEWSKFTTGIDSVLKKTQGDLDRIKSTSYFQKVPTQAEKAKAKKEHEQQEKEKQEEEAKVAEEEAKAAIKESRSELIDAVVELSESETSEDDPEDIFDTTYIDSIAPGNNTNIHCFHLFHTNFECIFSTSIYPRVTNR